MVGENVVWEVRTEDCQVMRFAPACPLCMNDFPRSRVQILRLKQRILISVIYGTHGR